MAFKCHGPTASSLRGILETPPSLKVAEESTALQQISSQNNFSANLLLVLTFSYIETLKAEEPRSYACVVRKCYKNMWALNRYCSVSIHSLEKTHLDSCYSLGPAKTVESKFLNLVPAGKWSASVFHASLFRRCILCSYKFNIMTFFLCLICCLVMSTSISLWLIQ